jgi:3-oxoacyl-[acyl-carrier-protein] synthase-3
MSITAAIKGVDFFVPETVMTNADFAKTLDTSDEWIMERTGIKERHILHDKDKACVYLAVNAAKKVLEKTNTNPEDIDLLILTTATPELQFPASANMVAYELGCKNAWSFDLLAACSGFLYTLQVASQFIKTGTHKKVLIIGSEKMSSILDYTDRKLCILFGDGAGAAILEPNNEGNGILDAALYSDGYGKQFLYQPAGGSLKPASEETVRNKEHFVKMEGQAVFKYAVVKMADSCEEIMKRNNLKNSDIKYMVAHQANKRIITATAERLGLTEEQTYLNIDRYGNTTTASIPICLAELSPKLKKGDNIIIASFGAGFTWGAMWLKWGH